MSMVLTNAPRLNYGSNAITATWTPAANGETSDEVAGSNFIGAALQVYGTFGAGGTILLEGSNDGVVYATLDDFNGDPVSITAASIVYLSQTPVFVRMRVSAGDVTTSLTAILLLRRQSNDGQHP